MKTRMLTHYEFNYTGFHATGTCDIWASKTRKAWPQATETAVRTMWVGARPRCFESECKVCPK